MAQPEGFEELLAAVNRSSNQSALEQISKHADAMLASKTISEAEYKNIQDASKKRSESF